MTLIAGCPTSVTAFVGWTPQGPVGRPVALTSLTEYRRIFGEALERSTVSHAVRSFFANGGRQAVILRLVHRARAGASPGEEDLETPDYLVERGGGGGLLSLDGVPTINLLCIPPYRPGVDVSPELWGRAATYCEGRRAVLLIDPPSRWQDVPTALAGVEAIGTRSPSAALYFPSLRPEHPHRRALSAATAPCGAVAGVIARVDATSGVWRASAGSSASLVGVVPALPLTDLGCEQLAHVGINALRTLPSHGTVVWGARTLAGSAQWQSEWRYLPVRRLVLYLEESLTQGIRWAAPEPNDELLWARIRASVSTFMGELWRQGAFAGRIPSEAFYVRCDGSTTTPADVVQGRLTLVVGFAPVKPADFVVIMVRLVMGTP